MPHQDHLPRGVSPRRFPSLIVTSLCLLACIFDVNISGLTVTPNLSKSSHYHHSSVLKTHLGDNKYDIHDRGRKMMRLRSLVRMNGGFISKKCNTRNTSLGSENDDNNNNNDNTELETTTSKREMLNFALPALGIYLSNPLLSNIDNSFVGHTVGTTGLAALSPATLCTDQMLYLFSFLSRATTGLVSLAYAGGTKGQESLKASREAASTPLTASLLLGFLLSIFYFKFTPTLLTLLNVQDPIIKQSAASYVYFRGAITWAALFQASSLSIMMATRDSITPFKIISLSAILNVLFDYLFCVTPFRWGCSGASAATALATLFSTGFMIRALRRKDLLPKMRVPTKENLMSLLEFTGPLFAITVTRLLGFLCMQRTASRLGVKSLASYQLCLNLLVFFLLFGEPLSQLSQTQLPPLINRSNTNSLADDDVDGGDARIVKTIRSILTIATLTALGVGMVAYGMAFWGSGFFTSDPAVQLLTRETSISVFIAVVVAIMTVAIDGAMLASRDFGFMLLFGISTFVIQVAILKRCTTLASIFMTFTFRLGTYAIGSMIRVLLGYGNLGRAVWRRGRPPSPVTEKA